jgi:tRNA 5-methylaminomethyl-2-thiouridine biosynthesis bifunctional protein
MYSVPYAQIQWLNNSAPYSTEFEDIYFPAEDPLRQTEDVFLAGNDLPKKWANSTASHTSPQTWTIGELGFGCALNFLATLHEWKRHISPNAHLYYIAFEATPIRKSDLERVFKTFPQFSSEASALLRYYPLPLRGNHRILLSQYNATLDLVFGDANETLAEQMFTADAWYLDGFSPNRNRSLWNKSLFQTLVTKSHSETTFATYSSAGWLRRELEEAGCTVMKEKHSAGKRETIRGVFRAAAPKPTRPNIKRVSIIGGGYAGVTLATCLARRGVTVQIHERAADICSQASGNSQAVLLPYITRKPSAASNLYLSAFLYARQQLTLLEEQSGTSLLNTPGIIHFPSTTRLQTLLEELDRLQIPESVAQRLNGTELKERYNLQSDTSAFFYELGSWVHPSSVAKTLLQEQLQRIEVIPLSDIRTDAFESLYDKSDLVICANAFEARAFFNSPDLPIEPVRGQLAFVKANALSQAIRPILCYDGYLLPSDGKTHLIGASYDHHSFDTTPRESENMQMLSNLNAWLPELFPEDTDPTTARVAFRTSTKDRLPIVGSIDHEKASFPKTIFFTGFGSRGVTSIPLLAEYLTSSLLGEPLPLSEIEMNAISADRFRQRRRRKSGAIDL